MILKEPLFINLSVIGGADRDRTDDLRLAKPALSQLSYSPGRSNISAVFLVGLGRVELPTSPLSGVRSNQLSYRPVIDILDPSGSGLFPGVKLRAHAYSPEQRSWSFKTK